MRYSSHCTNANEHEPTSTRSDNSNNRSISAPSDGDENPCSSTPRMANQIFNTKAVECLAIIQRRIVDLARQRIPTYRARVGDRLRATLFQRGGGSAEDMSSDREENLGAAVGVANDVQPFV